MISSHPARPRLKRVGIAFLATAVLGGVTPLIASSASAAVSLPAPALVGPSSVDAPLKEVVLDWAAVAGADKYVVQVGTDDAWSGDPTLDITTVASRATLPTSLPHAAYVWRVAAVGAAGQGAWSSTGSFRRGWTQTSTPLSPVGRVDAAVPTFTWTPVPTASEYQLQVSTSEFFDGPFQTQANVKTESCFTTRTSVTPFNSQADAKNDGAGDCVFSLLGTGEERFWRVRPLDHVVDGAPEVNTTPIVDEGISSQPPADAGELDTSACPSEQGTTASPSPSPSTSPSPSPSPTSDAASGSCEPAHTVEKGLWSTSTSFTHSWPAAPAPVPYRDLVTAAGTAGAMPTPRLSTDVCSSNVCRDFPAVSWSKISAATMYRLYVALDPQYTNIHAIIETPGTSWTPTTQWRDSTAGASYYVVVQPCTSEGCDDPSAPATFRKSSPALAQYAPADAALLGPAVEDVVLSWQPASEALRAATGSAATSEAYAYHVQISTPDNPNFSAAGLIDDAVVDSTHYVSSGKVLADGAYLWRVQTVDASGHRLPWSAVRSLTRDTGAPTFKAAPTFNVDPLGVITITFSEKVTGVSDASITLSGVAASVTASADGRSATLKPTQALSPGAAHTLSLTSAIKDFSGNALAPASVPVSVRSARATPSEQAPGAKEIVLDWPAVAGATKYVVQVDTDQEWSGAPTLELTTVASRITLPTSLPHAEYIWRWAAVTSAGQGRWSATGGFTREWNDSSTPLSPVGRVDAAVPTFTWTPVPTASEYQLQVSTSEFFDGPFQTQAGVKTESCFTTRTSVTPFNSQADAKNDGAGDCVFSLLGTGEERFWRVRPLDHVVDGAPEVNTTPIVDEGISSLPPADAGGLDTSACPSGAGTTDEASPSPSTESSPSPSPSPTSDAASGSCEPAHTVEKGPWSQTTSFSHTAPAAPSTVKRYVDLVLPVGTNPVTGIAPMPTPTLSADVCRDGVCRDFPTISWPKIDGAQAYRLYVALDRQYTNIHAIIETAGTSWTPTTQWRDSSTGAAYYVVVQPCTTSPSTEPTPRDPGCDDPSAPVIFRKSSPKLAQVLPADGALLGQSTEDVVLSWQPASEALSAAIDGPATSEAYAYRVQISTPENPDFHAAGLVDEATVDAPHYVSSEKVLADGVYLWRVQTIDGSGHHLPWSATRTFTRDTTPPTFAVTPATNLPINGKLTVTFSEKVKGISASSVTLPGASVTAAASADGLRAVLTPTARLMPGRTHPVTVSSVVTDLAGNASVAKPIPVRVDPMVDDRSPAMGLGGSWQRLFASNAVKNTYSRSVPTRTKNTAVTVALYGRGAEVKGCVGPGNGVFELWADGVRLTRIDTYRSYSGCGVVLTRAPFKSGDGAHRIQVRGVGVKNAKSKGTAIGIDAITAVK